MNAGLCMAEEIFDVHLQLVHQQDMLMPASGQAHLKHMPHGVCFAV